MGTTITVLLPVRQATPGIEVVRLLFDEWEQRLSRFLPGSELSLLNGHAGEPVRVSAILYTVLMTALTAADATHGLYDPTLQRQMLAVGYDRSFDELAADVRTLQSHSATPTLGGGWRHIQVDRSDRRVTLPVGVGLDFGGIAKGMAVDAATERLRRLGITTALVNAGGDLAVLGQPPDAESWPIAVSGKEASWIVPLHHGAMATSGRTKRHWRQGERERHHLLDPRTGEPAQSDLETVTVTADRCEQAEVAAKVAFVLGAERGAAFLRAHQLSGVLVGTNGAWAPVDSWPSATPRPDVAPASVPAKEVHV